MDNVITKETQVKEDQKTANFAPSDLVFKLLQGLNQRTRNVIIKRFGLDGNERQTLEEIGRSYGITRERVRQIESSTLKDFKKSKKIEHLKPLEETLEKLLHEHGKIMEHGHLVNEFKKLHSDEKLHPNHLEFALTLSPRFCDIDEDETRKKGWSVAGVSKEVHDKIIKAFSRILQKEKSPIAEDKALVVMENHEDAKEIAKNRKAVLSYLNLSKDIIKNPYGEWGLASWSEVMPRGVKDKAYLVMKKAGRPLHFRQITDFINEKKFSDRKANYQTVHNELIKDKRFVLVGRGIYALIEWGYRAGTVSDIVAGVLKKSGKSLSRNEIVDGVLKQRLVKKNTIVLALQNKEKFERVGEGQYKLVE